MRPSVAEEVRHAYLGLTRVLWLDTHCHRPSRTDPDVGVAQRHFRSLSLLDTDEAEREPDDSGVAVDVHGEVVLDCGLDLLVEGGGVRQLGRIVADPPIVVGRGKLVREELFEERDVLAIERLVPSPFQLTRISWSD